MDLAEKTLREAFDGFLASNMQSTRPGQRSKRRESSLA